MKSYFSRVLLWGVTLILLSCSSDNNKDVHKLAADSDQELAKQILNNSDFDIVLNKAHSILNDGLNAGSGYGEVWIRDLNTFIEFALQVQDQRKIRESLITFFHFQGEDGNIIDGYIPAARATGGYEYIESATKPHFKGHKNTVETDQETSLIQAIHKYIVVTGDQSILNEIVNDLSVQHRLAMALDFLMQHRFNSHYGLLWGATTVDWGDVQPEHDWGVVLDENSHIAIDIYDNAMFIIAINNFLELVGSDFAEIEKWVKIRENIIWNVREYLWDETRHKFRPHLYVDGSPFPDDFDEERIYYHGGTAIAIEAGLLSPEEIQLVLYDMRNNKRFAGAASIGLTIFPAYPKGYFKNRSMAPYSYQNGGDWTWFGGRMIQQLVANGFIQEAYTELLPMVERVRENDGFFEWYTVDNQPRGSGTFRGSAGVLSKAIQMLQQWARNNS
jgi:glycogen debranching enzyme